MMLWGAVLAACVLSFGLKLSGYVVPERYVQRPWIQRIIPLLPVALLTSLLVTQAFLGDAGRFAVDARAVGVCVAVLALMLRAPFLVVIVAAAATAALTRTIYGY
ncbi:AzlD domain-containing protein [Ornithinimicrobium sp. INDO-MA30-4]|uniref:AzlD domain-containing protein n=1 Tax=Ornithinimicrobium sp. INDO-MA30-4 TaxID=2908651 RepID=UPI001F3AC626|nr:AzlD domain-containing protein [Ornithinimicrobium sp. INDO-MA30-4]UJH70724.1 AzlD domain-containing protein [Ornithinimicrobium sp. INDO-MA30-4]